MVPCVVRARSADVGDRAAVALRLRVRPARMDFRHGVLFWDVLVAHIRADPLRVRALAARVFFNLYRLPTGRTLSGNLYDDTCDSDSPLRLVGIPRRAICLGIQ